MMSLTEAFLLIILTFIIFVIFIAIFIYLMHSVFRWGKVRWGFGFFPPGIVLWKKSVEEELSELRSYEMWLKSELDRIRREIEEREKHKS